MDQKKLEEKARELFEEQGFEVREKNVKLVAEKDGQELVLNPFSSEDYSVQEVENHISEGEKVFVDESLERVKEEIDNQVSVLREEEREEYNLPSYEIIGEIAVINELTVEEDEAIEGILEHHPSVKTILLKEEPLQGEYRVGEYRKLYGEETETVHREYGCRFKVDPTKVYYSERFSTERKRVVDLIEDREKVLVMFAGVGPFAIMAAKLANPEKVVAAEKNPVAAEYLKENIELNDVGDVVEGYDGDVREVVPKLNEKFDRVIMPLPEASVSFLDLLNNSVISDSGLIHIYSFLENGNWSSLESEITENFSKMQDNAEILEEVICGERGPSAHRVCIDLKLI